MRLRWLNLLLIFFALTSLAKAQDRIIAGYHLEKLSCALENGVVVLEHSELRSHISEHKLSALLIPGRQKSTPKVIGLCFDKQRCSGSTDWDVSEKDYRQLIEYADHKAFEKAATVNRSREKGSAKEMSDARTQVNEYAAALREPERAPTRRFIGSVLIDSKPTEPDLVLYVEEYQDYVKQNAESALAAILRSSTLTPGEPLVTVGSTSFTGLDLEKVNPAEVETFEVGTNKFKGAWVGSSFIIVPQSGQKVAATDRTGLGLSETWAKSSGRIIPQIPVRVDVPDQRNLEAGEIARNIKGIVIKRDPDSFTIAETTGGPQTTVLLTANTEVKSHKRGVFRGSKEYGASYILRGLRLEVNGIRNADGSIVADKIRFDEQDLRTAQALKANVDPAEAELTEKLRQQQAEQERLAGQIEENRELIATAQASADAAARKAQATADYANNRINGLDDFDPIRTITVYFPTGSAALSPKAKADIDNAAAWIKTQNTKSWVMAVVGYADTTGNSQRNIDLSERRANAVIYYIVSKYKIPLNRLVQPFGYGQLEPVAENATRIGRAKNRRVEIRLMVNKGIAGGPGI
jgi:outer membrane protein OmpA-like peptidoglycan-associated protein